MRTGGNLFHKIFLFFLGRNVPDRTYFGLGALDSGRLGGFLGFSWGKKMIRLRGPGQSGSGMSAIHSGQMGRAAVMSHC
jgi:hypothetical protein